MFRAVSGQQSLKTLICVPALIGLFEQLCVSFTSAHRTTTNRQNRHCNFLNLAGFRLPYPDVVGYSKCCRISGTHNLDYSLQNEVTMHINVNNERETCINVWKIVLLKIGKLRVKLRRKLRVSYGKIERPSNSLGLPGTTARCGLRSPLVAEPFRWSGHVA